MVTISKIKYSFQHGDTGVGLEREFFVGSDEHKEFIRYIAKGALNRYGCYNIEISDDEEKSNKRYLQWIVVCCHEDDMCNNDDKCDDEICFAGVLEPFYYNRLATIEMLRDDIERQRLELREGTHEEGYLIPFSSGDEILMTKDGAFIWDSDEEDYIEVLILNVYKEKYRIGNSLTDVFMAEYELMF